MYTSDATEQAVQHDLQLGNAFQGRKAASLGIAGPPPLIITTSW